jgi:hypothetical protein
MHVVEHGCGGYSSPVVSHFCKELGLQRVVVETDVAWLAKHGGDALHHTSVASFASWLKPGTSIGLALIDGDQRDRQRMIELCRDALFIVVHDTEMMELYGYNFAGFTVIERSGALLPQTTVLQRQ